MRADLSEAPSAKGDERSRQRCGGGGSCGRKVERPALAALEHMTINSRCQASWPEDTHTGSSEAGEAGPQSEIFTASLLRRERVYSKLNEQLPEYLKVNLPIMPHSLSQLPLSCVKVVHLVHGIPCLFQIHHSSDLEHCRPDCVPVKLQLPVSDHVVVCTT